MGTVLRCVRADYLKAKRSMLNVMMLGSKHRVFYG